MSEEEPEDRNEHIRRMQEIDQNIEFYFRDAYPRSWWALYEGCIEQGFKPQDALDLVKTYILSKGSEK